jgi:hypothetical protein
MKIHLIFRHIQKEERPQRGRSTFILQSYNIFPQNPNLTNLHRLSETAKIGHFCYKLTTKALTFVNVRVHRLQSKDELKSKRFCRNINLRVACHH